jgi:hypothetical protein
MSKPYAKLSSLDYDKLYKLEESGMGYYIIRGRLDYDQSDRTLVVAGDRIVPATDDEFFSVAELWKREPFPQELRSGVSLHNPQPTTSTFTLPSGYVASVGAIPLLGTVQLAAATKFYRFIMATTDHRYSSGVLAAGTYLTTDLDRLLANTGFGAVGRYALPIPVPASFVFEYELPANTVLQGGAIQPTVLQVGTVQPNFGQAGGGVEVKTTTPLTATQKPLKNLANY